MIKPSVREMLGWRMMSRSLTFWFSSKIDTHDNNILCRGIRHGAPSNQWFWVQKRSGQKANYETEQLPLSKLNWVDPKIFTNKKKIMIMTKHVLNTHDDKSSFFESFLISNFRRVIIIQWTICIIINSIVIYENTNFSVVFFN